MERCPTCRARVPQPRTCPGCDRTFYRGPGGRSDAIYCTERCGARVRKRRQRQRRRAA